MNLKADERATTRGRERALPPWLSGVREMLQVHGMGRLTLKDLARCAGRHPVQISREFHRYFGCTIGAYVRQVRIAHAQRLLSLDGMSVAEIALACGFSDQSHFTTQFRRLTGLPPKKFRDSKRERDASGDSARVTKPEELVSSEQHSPYRQQEIVHPRIPEPPSKVSIKPRSLMNKPAGSDLAYAPARCTART